MSLANHLALAQVRTLPAPTEPDPTAQTAIWNSTGSVVSGWVVNVGPPGKEFDVETDKVGATTLHSGELLGIENAAQVIITTATDGCQGTWILLYSPTSGAALADKG